MRAYYSDSIKNFITLTQEHILGILATNNQFDLTDLQRNSWGFEIKHLKNALQNFNGRILFEYIIPRMGKRVDVVLLINNTVFLLEYKHGNREYSRSAIDQVYDYALDLKNFQKESHERLIVPIVVSTKAEYIRNAMQISHDKVMAPLCANCETLPTIISKTVEQFHEPAFDYGLWENSIYMPTPTIIEAAQALYRGHNVKDISRSDSGAANLTLTSRAINSIIDYTKENNRKSIVFITGVPGAGKTLAGLNIANERHQFDENEHAVFLSGNFPLVQVLQEALARDKVLQSSITKKEALRDAASFIQIIHHFRDDCLATDQAPIEKVAVFDEAQRAWTVEQIAKFMAQKKGIPNFTFSEPEFLISSMDRHEDWAVLICLIGGGQEINTGEAGLPEWFNSLRRSFSHWDVYVSDQLYHDEYTRGQRLSDMLADLHVKMLSELHLATSIRSFRSEKVSELVRLILENEAQQAREMFAQIKASYPIHLTRDLAEAKNWVRGMARGSERYGIIASSGGLRLKACGVYVKNSIKPSDWFLNYKDDVRSSFYLEDVATEFDIQGLELDYAVVALDADFRHNGNEWTYNRFIGTNWQCVNNPSNRLYLKNAYRVLLTRARQGMVIYIPQGDDFDATRANEYYDGTYEFLNSILKVD